MDIDVSSRAVMLLYDTLQIVLCSRKGDRHVEKNQPCQDACMAVQQFYKGYPYTLLAVADGHGSARYIRSEVGAHLAVQAVQSAATRFIPYVVEMLETQPREWRNSAQREFNNYFGKWLHNEWKKLVGSHHNEKLGEAPDEGGDTFEAYGTTIATMLIFGDLIFAGAIGDSVMYYIKQSEMESVAPVLPENSPVVRSQTDSLRSPYAHYIWDTRTINKGEIGMILLCTDGFSDSFKEPEEAVRDIFKKVRSRGSGWLKDILPQEMCRVSAQGVRDDISVIACFIQLDAKSTEAQQAERE